MGRSVSRALTGAGALLATGCHGAMSTLDTAGTEATEIAQLFWWMSAGAAVVWIAVTALALFALRESRPRFTRRVSSLLIVGGGVVLPAVLLFVTLLFGLQPLSRLSATPPSTPLRIDVAGEQWWWRVRYSTPDGGAIDLANEIRLPVGERIPVQLTSDNVIHSFWIPALAGKMDMIPGRVTHLSLEPTRTGTFRGACAEYCGTSHALMAFQAVVLERTAFTDWLANERQPARPPATPEAMRGQELFLANGCGACHAVRGTPAAGVIGPDLTHVGGRLSLAAGVRSNTAAAMAEWIREPDRIKPHTTMPAFRMLASDDVDAMAAYLSGLR